MNKFRAMSEHIEARRSIGIEVGFIQALWGRLNMLFVDQESIEGATENIRAGNVRYNKNTNTITVI